MTLSVPFDQINWPQVLLSFGIDASFLVNRHGPCPICGGKDRFRFDNIDNSGSFFCNHCGAGRGFRLLELFTGKSRTQLLSELQVQLQHTNFSALSTHVKKSDEEELQMRRLQLCKTWETALCLSGNDAASLYLKRRIPGLDLSLVSNHLRYHKALGYYEMTADHTYRKLGEYPALLSRVVNAFGEMVTLHRTYLTLDGHKAPVCSVKKLMRGIAPLKGAAVRLNAVPSKCLAVTEGIETALAILCAFQAQMNVWALLSCTNLAVADIPYHQFDEVIIFADCDSPCGARGIRAGEYHARLLAQRLRAHNQRVSIRLPQKEGTDFADVWLAHQQN